MSSAPDTIRITYPNFSTYLAGYRDLPLDLSFEPYRREAERIRSNPSQRDGIALDNIPGEGMVATNGLWRRGQTDWGMGAGLQFLDRKRQEQADRFLSSKGVDVFSFPMQATLLPDTHAVVTNASANLLMSRCGDFTVVAAGGVVTYYNSSWAATVCSAGAVYGGSAWTVVYSICTDDIHCYIATDTGIWFCNIGNSGGTYLTPASAFELYAANDVATGYTGGYDLVRWANDQLIASRFNRLYAFQPRTATSFPTFGVGPSGSSTVVPIQNILNSVGTVTVNTIGPHGFGVGEPVTIATTATSTDITLVTLSGNVLTCTSGSTPHGFVVGESVTTTLFFNGVPNGRTETATITAIGTYTFSYKSTKVGAGAINTGFTVGVAIGDETHGYNGQYTIATVPFSTSFTFAASLTFGTLSVGGTVSASVPSDVLYNHVNTNWVWSDAVGGETQIYFGGYVKSSTGAKYSGCIYRSNLNGSSVTTASGTTTTSNSTVTQPFSLNTPIQALPMSPDEYPLCVKSYLNFIFIGTNRGIRMCQTLSVYDPTATQSGDLKSGPLIPNILQPIGNSGVTAIVGDGRYVWFAWSNYDGTSTGLGKLNLAVNIDGDLLSPAYASDLMVTGQGIVTALEWNPINNVPIMAVQGLGVYAPYATNAGGNIVVSQYVASGSVTSGLFTYGIADLKIPIYFNYGAIAANSTTLGAVVTLDPGDPTGAGAQTIAAYPAAGRNDVSLAQPYSSAEQIQVTVTLNSDVATKTHTPILNRWMLKSLPAIVNNEDIMTVIRNYSVVDIDGADTAQDPYEVYFFFQELRRTQTVVTYTDGELSTLCTVELCDLLPHKATNVYLGGMEGNLIVTMPTIGDWVFTAKATS